jgi:hypothetical protein
LAEAGDGWQPREGLRLVLRGRLDAGQRDVAEQPSIGVNQGEVDVDTLRHRGLRAPCCHARSVRLVGQRLPEFRPMVLAVGLLPVREERGALTGQRDAAPEEVAGGPQRSGIDRGLWEHPAAA